ncbi:MAG TPA: MFS transporter [Rhizomicrobium sp.]
MVSTDVVAAVTEAERPNAEAATGAALGHTIPNWKLTIYSLPSIPIAFLYLPVALLMPAYYASEMHVSLAAVGGFLVLSRVADVFLDPMIGKWSDSTRSRWGRRKLWMIIGTPILMLGSLLLFMPMIPVGGVYLMVASFVIYAGGSTVGLPYSAWGTEIVETYHGRARMAGFRETAGVIGGFVAASIPAVTGYFGHGVDRFTMSILGWMIIVLTPLTVWIALTFVEEPPVKRRVYVPWWPSIVALMKNKPFRIFCGAYVIFTIGGSIASATMVFYITSYVGDPQVVGASLLLLAVTTVLAVPLWLRISRRIGKHRAMAISLLGSMVFFGLLMPMIKPGQGHLFIWLVGILGVTSSGSATLPIGIIGDIIDYDTLIHRQPRGGIYWGMWSFAQKASPALAIGATLPLLTFLGFNPGGHNTPAALDALKYVFCFGPIPFYVVGSVLLFWFPIDARRHGIIRRRLMAQEARMPKSTGSGIA